MTLVSGFANAKACFAGFEANKGARNGYSLPEDIIYQTHYKALEIDSVYSFEIAKYLGMRYLSKVKYRPEIREKLIYIADKIRPDSPFDWHRQMMLALINRMLCRDANDNKCQLALENIQLAKRLSPNRYHIYLEESKIYEKLNNSEKAQESFDKSVNLM